jgi:hypothetical protein
VRQSYGVVVFGSASLKGVIGQLRMEPVTDQTTRFHPSLAAPCSLKGFEYFAEHRQGTIDAVTQQRTE